MGRHADEWEAALPSGSDRWRALAPLILLVVVALIGVRNHVEHQQSSWQGASFGMFATYDNPSTRLVVVEVVGRDGETSRVRLPPGLRDEARRLRVAPSVDAAGTLAEDVLALLSAPAAVAVRVELWVIRVEAGDDVAIQYERLLTAGASS